jgi:hypothetical protein
MINCIFIGGIFDGESRTLDILYPQYKVPISTTSYSFIGQEHSAPTKIELSVDTYSPYIWSANSAIYVLDTLPNEQVLSMLSESYSKQRGKTDAR